MLELIKLCLHGKELIMISTEMLNYFLKTMEAWTDQATSHYANWDKMVIKSAANT